MQAIETKFLGPTNHRGSRIVAKCQAKRITVAWDHSLDVKENHRRAAEALVKALGWDDRRYYGEWYLGALPGSGYAYVQAPRVEQVVEDEHGHCGTPGCKCYKT
jgi:hypothetical protein